VSELLTEIKNYYSRNNIQPSSYSKFRCPNKKLCRDECELLTTGMEPSVGSRYEDRIRPRLLIISADPAEGDQYSSEGRTIEGHRDWEREEKDEMRTRLAPKTHWFKTSQIAVWIFEVIEKKKLSRWVWNAGRRDKFPAVAPYWAHTNSGKCSQNKPDRGQASDILFKKCQPYLGREVRILNPDIIVTQGKHAREALNAAVEWREVENVNKISLEVGDCNSLLLRSHLILWIVMPHPNAHNNLYYGTTKARSPYWATRIKRFLIDIGWPV
jgi:hypothetical protein